MIRPPGAEAMLFIASTTASLKLGSGSSARATRRIAVNGFASSADACHGIPNTTSNAQRARVIGRTRGCTRLSADYKCIVGIRRLGHTVSEEAASRLRQQAKVFRDGWRCEIRIDE